MRRVAVQSCGESQSRWPYNRVAVQSCSNFPARQLGQMDRAALPEEGGRDRLAVHGCETVSAESLGASLSDGCETVSAESLGASLSDGCETVSAES